MTGSELNRRIISCGREIFRSIQGRKPALYERGQWPGKLMAWCMSDEHFKNQLFRFVDVFPSLTTSDQVAGHMREYFRDQSYPPLLSLVPRITGMLGGFGDFLLKSSVSSVIKTMARQFIIGEKEVEAVRRVEELRDEGFAAVVDVLGEATLSEREADAYVAQYLDLIDQMHSAAKGWNSLGTGDTSSALDWGHTPKVNVSVKATAMYCLANPMDFDGTVAAILKRLRLIYERVMEVGGFLCLDMETYRHKDVVLEAYRRLRLEYPGCPNCGVVLQSYLRDTDHDLDLLLGWAREHNLPISIRLVKGAYWDYEVVKARQSNLPVPVWTLKAETDAAFERQARCILENHDICHFACASHNIRSISAVMELGKELVVPPERYEFQVLYGMAEPVRKAVLERTGRLRLYCPYGPMVPEFQLEPLWRPGSRFPPPPVQP